MTKLNLPRSSFPHSRLTLLLAALPPSADVSGRVVSVHDGDTLTVLIDHRQVRVRLTDIDAPELGQPFGTRSRQSLSDLCFGKTAALDVRGQDRYKRTLAHVTCAGTDANSEQVRRGYAWTLRPLRPPGFSTPRPRERSARGPPRPVAGFRARPALGLAAQWRAVSALERSSRGLVKG